MRIVRKALEAVTVPVPGPTLFDPHAGGAGEDAHAS
jgi:hypothetical protein